MRNRATELEKKRVELDASEREEAELLVELEGLLKGKDSSLSLSSTLHAEEIEAWAWWWRVGMCARSS